MRRISPGAVRWKNQRVLLDMIMTYHESGARPQQRVQACSASDSLLDQRPQKRPVAVVFVLAGT